MAKIQNLNLDQGTTFVSNLVHLDKNKNPIDITGFDIRGQFRKSYNSANAYTLTANVIDASNGAITLSMSYLDTANVKAGRYVYDIEIYNGNVVNRIFEGLIVVNPEVTKNG